MIGLSRGLWPQDPCFTALRSHFLIPTIAACFACRRKIYAENAKFYLPLSDMPDSCSPQIGRCISQGSTEKQNSRGYMSGDLVRGIALCSLEGWRGRAEIHCAS